MMLKRVQGSISRNNLCLSYLNMQKLRLLSVLAFVLLSVSGFAQDYVLLARMVDKQDAKAIVGGTISIDGTVLAYSSDTKGFVKIPNLKRSVFTVFVTCTGYKPIHQKINLEMKTEFVFELEETRSQLDEIVVLGTSTKNTLKDAPVQTELYNNNLINSVNSGDFESLMTNISAAFDFSPTNMGSRMQLNGLGNDYILIQIDGKRVYGDVGGQTDLGRINPANIKKIEVVKGALSSLYGSEAMAGVINIITKESANKLHLENSTRIGQYGDWQQYNSINIKTGKISSNTQYTHKHSDGWQLSPFALVRDKKHKGKKILAPSAAKSVNEFTDNEIRELFKFDLNEKLKLHVDASFYQKDVLQPIEYKSYGFLYENISISTGAKYIINESAYLDIDVSSDDFSYFKKYSAKYNERYTLAGGEEKQVTYYTGDKIKNTQQKRKALKINGVFSLNNSNKLNTGIEYLREDLEAQYRLKDKTADAYSLSAFLQDEYSLTNKFSLVAGLRYSYNQAYSDVLTPKISALYKISDFNLRASYGAAYKAPSLKELYLFYESSGMGSHNLYLGNEDLKAQSSDYYSFSLEYNKNAFSASITSYLNKIDGLIAYRIVETSADNAERGIVYTKQNHNIAKAESRGVDFMLNAYIGEGFTLSGGYSYVDAQNISEDKALEATAHHYGNVSCSWSHKWKTYKLGVSLKGRMQSEKYFEKGNADAYQLWRLNTTHDLKRIGDYRFKASVGVDNILDYVDSSPYGASHGTLSPGRTFYLSLNIQLTK